MRPIHIIHLVDIQVYQGTGTVPYKYKLNPDIAQGCFLFPKNTHFSLSLYIYIYHVLYTVDGIYSPQQSG